MATATTERGVRRWWRRVGWLVAIWAGSVISLAVVAGLFRWLMAAVGLTR
jgi:hypothetical protein